MSALVGTQRYIRVVVNLDKSGKKWGIYAIIRQGVGCNSYLVQTFGLMRKFLLRIDLGDK
jgi:hypothetical protein